jgi:hypothetical protein
MLRQLARKLILSITVIVLIVAAWHAVLDDHREAAYQVMQIIALKHGIDRIRMFNSAGHVTFSIN